MSEDRRYVSVLPHEALAYLSVRPGARYVDGTLGDGGHTQLLLEAEPTLEVLGVDRDSVTLAATAARLAAFGTRLRVQRSTFDRIGEALAAVGWDAVDGLLLDLGISSRQLDDPARGFTFQASGPLDMRMTPDEGPSAADLLATLDERALADILWRYGEKPASRRIARAIVAERARAPIVDTAALADLVARVVPRRGSLHPATRVFQALRIVVNGELDHLEAFLDRVLDWLRPRARLVIIAYHSLEDRRVKQAFQAWAASCRCPPALPRCGCGARARVRILTRKVVTPSDAEVRANRRARSARLRALETLETAA